MLARISSCIESLILIFFSVLFASNAYAQFSPTPFIDLEYFYDGVGNVDSITDYIDPQNDCTMQYDSLDRLTVADGPWGAGSFTYDSIGNRTSKDINGQNISYTYGTSDNRLGGFSYDANGNIIGDGTFTYTYDSENRLIQVTNGADVITYGYDGDGRRISQTTNGETTIFAYGVGLSVLTEFSGTGVPKFDYIYAGSRNIARINFDGTGVPVSKTFYHPDHLGSTIGMTDQETTKVWDRMYLPYGGTFTGTGTTENTHQYTAKELEAATGLYYYGARYHNPNIGRFMSPDPAGADPTDPQSWNRYAYVQNNPMKYVDPNGEQAVVVDLHRFVESRKRWRKKLDFVPEFLLDVLLPIDPQSIASGFLLGPQALETAVISKGVSKALLAKTKINNPVPSRVARVVDQRIINRGATRLGAPDAADVFVTAADDIADILSSESLAERLTLLNNEGKLRRGPFAVIEFDTPGGIASPVFRTNPGFVGFGLTAGGAMEFVLPNLTLEELTNVTIRTVP
jgi:RHS repeat-associated protein